MKRLGWLLIITVGLVAVGLKSQPAAAYTNGRMIDDQVFDNVNSMSEGQIRSFILSHPNTCLTRTGANLGGGNVFPEPHTYWDYSGNVDAARVIYVAAQNWGLNPQVILATLQKEQSLLTDNDCLDFQGVPTLPKAMGQGCAEGGPCPSAAYNGFSQQVMKGAWQIKFNKERAYGNTSWDGDDNVFYGGFMTQGNRKRCGTCATNFYSGNATIDGQSIYIENGATASLFTYTPHLNQSFPRIFEQYFGSTWAFAYAGQYAGQSAWPTLLPGQTNSAFIKYRNVGYATWYDDTSVGSAPSGTLPVHLATTGPINRHSDFGGSWGGNQNRPTMNFSAVYESDGVTLATNQHVVGYGQIAKFSFTLSAPGFYSPGTYQESFTPVVEGSSNGAFPDPGTYLNINVQQPNFAASYVSQSAWPSLMPGQSATGSFNYRNIGNMTWYDDSSVGSAPAGSLPVHLATSHPINRASAFGSSWSGNRNRPNLTFTTVYESDGTTQAADQHKVTPGQIAKFSFTFNVSANQPSGTYREFFQPVVEGSSDGAFADPGTYLDVTVQPTIYADQFVSQSSYPSISPGGSSSGFFMFKNAGNVNWYDDSSVGSAPAGSLPVHLATTNPINRSSAFGSSWGANRNRPNLTFSAVYEANGTTLAGDQHVVTPGQIAKFSFTFNVASNQPTGTYREFFQPIVEGTADGRLNNVGAYLDVSVH